MNQKDLDKLEALVDKYGFGQVLFGIQDICYAKAEHLQTNWQDENSATEWKRRAELAYRCGRISL